MSDIAIRVENLGKQYRIGTRQRGYKTLRESLMSAFTTPFRRLAKREPENRRKGEPEHFPDSPIPQLTDSQPLRLSDSPIPRSPDPQESDTIWALKDVSFEVKQGEVVGIIGRNGAGKSTLLKILSRITKPTQGRAEIHGRVGSLLEVGTGFHPELTGRENIYLNGAILGMKKAEIERKFDEMVAFAEVEKFIDTPVKHYSSGMYVRLAFAVAAQLEPEILLVDEVLAVGDAAFQKKCLGKMRDVADSGRTVLFVSHNMNAVMRLCSMAILLSGGATKVFGDVGKCVKEYLSEDSTIPLHQWKRRDLGPRTPLTVISVALRRDSETRPSRLTLTVDMRSYGGHKNAFLAFDIQDASGMTIMQALPTCDSFITERPGNKKAVCEIDLPPLIPGTYLVTIWVGPHNLETFDVVKHVVGFEVTESPTPRRTFPHTIDHGYVVPDSRIVTYVD